MIWRILMALAIMGLALAIATTPIMCSKAYGATELGFGGYYGKNVEGFGGTPDEYNYELGTVNLYYGWKNIKGLKDLHFGFELYAGMYEFHPGGDEFMTGINFNATYDIFKYFYIEGGIGAGYVSGAPGHKGEVMATHYVPSIAQAGLGFKIPTVDDNYYRIGARIIHQSGIFYGKPFTKYGDPGVNTYGIFVSYYW